MGRDTGVKGLSRDGKGGVKERRVGVAKVYEKNLKNPVL